MTVCAINEAVLIEFDERNDRTEGGIHIPATVQRENGRWGKVRSIGQIGFADGTVGFPLNYMNPEGNTCPVEKGDRVLVFGQGVLLPDQGERVELLKASQIVLVDCCGGD